MLKPKKRSPEAVEAVRKQLSERRQRLADLQTRGDAACSSYDLSMGYDAKYYLASGMIENQIAYYERELEEVTPLQSSMYAGEGDPEREAKLDAERVTLEFRQKSAQQFDRGKRPINESPLFDGEAQ